MPNTFLTPDMIAREALATLYNTVVMAQLVHRDYSQEFNGAVGDTVTVRKPAVFAAEVYDRGSGITIQNATEGSVAVVLDTLLDVSFAVTAEDLTLEIRDFGEQLLDPAMEAHAQKIDETILTLRDDITAEVGHTTGETWDDPRVLVDARTTLNQAKVPLTERRAVLGPVTAGEFLKDALFHQADQRGDTEGLRNASIGRKFGFDTYETQGIEVEDASGESDTEHSVAFHRTAFALVSRTLAMPRGAGEGRAASVGYKGFGLRVVYDYDIDQKQDVVSLDYLIGVKTLDATRAVLSKAVDA
jgi:hypothetical protein